MPGNNDEYNQMEKEFKFARQFWSPAVTSSWRGVKLLVAIVVCIGLSYLIAISIYSSPVTSIVGVCAFLITLVLASADLRQGVLRRILRRTYDQVQPVKVFEPLKYYFLNGHDDILFIENGRDLTAVGLFKLKAIPLIIKGNFERFIRSLYQQQVPVYWTYVQSPIDQGALLERKFSDIVTEETIDYHEDHPDEFDSQIENNNGVWGARLLLGTRRTVGSLFSIEASRLTLYQQLKADLFKISTAFISAYPHTILELLHGKELEKAFSITVTGGGIPAFF